MKQIQFMNYHQLMVTSFFRQTFFFIQKINNNVNSNNEERFIPRPPIVRRQKVYLTQFTFLFDCKLLGTFIVIIEIYRPIM